MKLKEKEKESKKVRSVDVLYSPEKNAGYKVKEATITYEKLDSDKVTSCLNLHVYDPFALDVKPVGKFKMGTNPYMTMGCDRWIKIPLGCKLEYTSEKLRHICEMLTLLSHTNNFNYYLQVAMLKIFKALVVDFSYDNKQVQMSYEKLLNSNGYHDLRCSIDKYNSCDFVEFEEDKLVKMALFVNSGDLNPKVDNPFLKFNCFAFLRYLVFYDDLDLLTSKWLTEEPSYHSMFAEVADGEVLKLTTEVEMYMYFWLTIPQLLSKEPKTRELFLDTYGEDLLVHYDNYMKIKKIA